MLKKARMSPGRLNPWWGRSSVFPRDQRIDEVLRDLVDGDQLAVLVAEELGDLTVVDVEDLRGKRPLVLGELLVHGLIACQLRGHAEENTDDAWRTANATISIISKGISFGGLMHIKRIRSTRGFVNGSARPEPPERSPKKEAGPRRSRPAWCGVFRHSKLGGELYLGHQHLSYRHRARMNFNSFSCSSPAAARGPWFRPFVRTSKCRWGPVARPVWPTEPMTRRCYLLIHNNTNRGEVSIDGLVAAAGWVRTT